MKTFEGKGRIINKFPCKKSMPSELEKKRTAMEKGGS